MNLRGTIGNLTRLACAWSHQEAAALAQVTPIAAERYCNRLCKEGVLVRTTDQKYKAGPEADAWRAITVKTRDGGNSRAYLAAQAIRDQLNARDFRVRTGREPLPDAVVATNIQAGISEQKVASRVGSVSIKECALFLNTSKWTIRRRIKCGAIPIIDQPGRPRIPKWYLVQVVKGPAK